jgi:hypothetical protein
MEKIKKIVDLWFERGEETACKTLYPNDCKGCPFRYQPDPDKSAWACKTIWRLIEGAAGTV